MRIGISLSALFVMIVISSGGCTQTTSREQISNQVLKGQGKQFPEEAVYVGDADGYHYFKLRSIYSYCGDHCYRVPASQWDLPRTFRLTDDASRWESVTWVDQDLLTRSRYVYALMVPSEPVTTGDMPSSMPSFQQNWQESPATLPFGTTGPATSPSGISAPTTQPAQ